MMLGKECLKPPNQCPFANLVSVSEGAARRYTIGSNHHLTKFGSSQPRKRTKKESQLLWFKKRAKTARECYGP